MSDSSYMIENAETKSWKSKHTDRFWLCQFVLLCFLFAGWINGFTAEPADAGEVGDAGHQAHGAEDQVDGRQSVDADPAQEQRVRGDLAAAPGGLHGCQQEREQGHAWTLGGTDREETSQAMQAGSSRRRVASGPAATGRRG